MLQHIFQDYFFNTYLLFINLYKIKRIDKKNYKYFSMIYKNHMAH